MGIVIDTWERSDPTTRAITGYQKKLSGGDVIRNDDLIVARMLDQINYAEAQDLMEQIKIHPENRHNMSTGRR